MVKCGWEGGAEGTDENPLPASSEMHPSDQREARGLMRYLKEEGYIVSSALMLGRTAKIVREKYETYADRSFSSGPPPEPMQISSNAGDRPVPTYSGGIRSISTI
jgi:hypothetical protein